MKIKLKAVRCNNCKYFDENVNYKGEGVCNKDGEYTREHRVCNKLSSDDDRRNAKLRRNGQYILLHINIKPHSINKQLK